MTKSKVKKGARFARHPGTSVSVETFLAQKRAERGERIELGLSVRCESSLTSQTAHTTLENLGTGRFYLKD